MAKERRAWLYGLFEKQSDGSLKRLHGHIELPVGSARRVFASALRAHQFAPDRLPCVLQPVRQSANVYRPGR